MYPKNIMTFNACMGDYQDVNGNIFDAAAAQAGTVPKVDMARVEKLLQKMYHIDFKKESKQSMSLQSRYVIQQLKDLLHFLPDLGQYEVGCTWCPGQPNLPDNRALAMTCYKCLENGKLKDKEFRA